MKEPRAFWFPCEPAALLGALAQMTPSEGYVYVVMLLRIYECGGACPDDIDAVARRTGLNKRVTTLALEKLFKTGRLRRDNDGIHNRKADEVVGQVQSKLKKRSTQGKEAAERRWEKTKSIQQNGHAIPIASALPNDADKELEIDSEKKSSQDSFSDVALSGKKKRAPRKEKPALPPALEISEERWQRFEAMYPAIAENLRDRAAPILCSEWLHKKPEVSRMDAFKGWMKNRNNEAIEEKGIIRAKTNYEGGTRTPEAMERLRRVNADRDARDAASKRRAEILARAKPPVERPH